MLRWWLSLVVSDAQVLQEASSLSETGSRTIRRGQVLENDLPRLGQRGALGSCTIRLLLQGGISRLLVASLADEGYSLLNLAHLIARNQFSDRSAQNA